MWVSSNQTVLQQPTTHINMYNKNCMYPFVNCMYCKFPRINDSWFLIPERFWPSFFHCSMSLCWLGSSHVFETNRLQDWHQTSDEMVNSHFLLVPYMSGALLMNNLSISDSLSVRPPLWLDPQPRMCNHRFLVDLFNLFFISGASLMTHSCTCLIHKSKK